MNDTEETTEATVTRLAHHAERNRQRAERAEKDRDEEHALRCDLERRFDHRLAGADEVKSKARGAAAIMRRDGYEFDAEAITALLVLADTLDAQRSHEARVAGEAIGHLRALAEMAIPTLGECTCPRRGQGNCDACRKRVDLARARDWLDTVKT